MNSATAPCRKGTPAGFSTDCSCSNTLSPETRFCKSSTIPTALTLDAALSRSRLPSGLSWPWASSPNCPSARSSRRLAVSTPMRIPPTAPRCAAPANVWGRRHCVCSFGNRQAKGTHIGTQNGPTWVQRYTTRGQSVGLAAPLWSCSRGALLLRFLRRAKRSRALRGRNSTRDSPADGAPMVHLPDGPRPPWWAGGLFSSPHWTPEFMPPKIPGVWGLAPRW